MEYFLLYFTFSHLADTFIQSNLHIRKTNKLSFKLYRYNTHTFKIKMTNAYISTTFQRKQKIKLNTIQNINSKKV